MSPEHCHSAGRKVSGGRGGHCRGVTINLHWLAWREGGKEGWKEGMREGIEGTREKGRGRGREGGREGERERGREGGREGEGVDEWVCVQE